MCSSSGKEESQESRTVLKTPSFDVMSLTFRGAQRKSVVPLTMNEDFFKYMTQAEAYMKYGGILESPMMNGTVYHYTNFQYVIFQHAPRISNEVPFSSSFLRSIVQITSGFLDNSDQRILEFCLETISECFFLVSFSLSKLGHHN